MVPMSKNKMQLLLVLFCMLMIGIGILMLCYLPDLHRGYRCVILLPAVYILCYILCISLMNPLGYDIKLILLFVFFIKLYVLPAFVIFSGDFDLSGFNSGIEAYILDAVVIQILEMISVTIGLIVFTPKQKRKSREGFNRETDRFVNRYVWRVIKACVAIIIIAIILYPSLLLQFRPLFFFSDEQELAWKRTSEVAVSTMIPYVYYPINWLLAVTRIALAYLLTIYIYEKRTSKSSNGSLILTTLEVAVILVVLVPDDVAASIIAALSLLILVTGLYPDKRKLIVGFVVLLSSGLFIYMFLVIPFLSADRMSHGVSGLSLKLNAYFSGFINMAGVLDMRTSEKAGYFVGDFLRSFPIIKGFFTPMSRSTELFNLALGYDPVYFSQIIPLEGQAFFYFGYLGVLAIPLLTIKCCIHSYQKMLLSKGTYDYFVYCFYTLFLAFGIVMYDFFLLFYLALSYVPLLLIKMVLIKKEKKGVSDEDINLSG